MKQVYFIKILDLEIIIKILSQDYFGIVLGLFQDYFRIILGLFY